MSGTHLYHSRTELSYNYGSHHYFSKTPNTSDHISHYMCVSLSLRGNAILNEIALKCLELVSKTLRALVLSGNPLVETVDYRLSVLIVLPQLERLDKEPVTSRERIEAQERIHVKMRNILILFTADALLVFLMSYVSFQELKEEEISEP